MLTLILLLTAVCFLAATARRWHPQAAFQDLRRRWDPNLVLIAVLLSLLPPPDRATGPLNADP